MKPSRALRVSVPVILARDDQAGRPFDQGANVRPLAGPLDEVTFPVAGYGTRGHLSGALGNRRHIGDLAASIGSPRPRLACRARLTQRGQQFAPQGAAGQHIQARLDGLGRQLFAHIVRIRALEPSGHLFGRAAFGQLCPDVLPQPGIQECARSPQLTSPRRCQGVRRAGPIGGAPRVAGVLAAHGAGGTSQYRGHRPQRMALGQAQAQRLTFFDTQVSIGSRFHGNTVVHLGR